MTRQVQAWKSRATSVTPIEENRITQDKSDDSSDKHDDDGILDLMEVFQDKFTEIIEITHQLASTTEDIGIKITARTAEIIALPKDSKGNANPKEAKRIISRAASDMNQFAARIDAELPLSPTFSRLNHKNVILI